MPLTRRKRILDEAERALLPGSFVRLSRGFAHYELSGPAAGPLVVLVPGLSVPYSTWERNAAALAGAGYRVLRYEHYGRGYSDRPRNSKACAAPRPRPMGMDRSARHRAYGLDLYVEQLAELVSALGLAKPLVLMGLSMGGPVAAAAVTRHPGIARALVLIDPLYEWPEQGLRSKLLALPFIGEAAMALRGSEILAAGQRGDFFDEASYREFIPSYLPPLAYRGVGRAVLATMRSIPYWPLARIYEELGRSGIPTLLFWGREDATLPYEQSAKLLALLPRAEFRSIEGAGHVPQWEKSAEVNGAILDFLHRAKSEFFAIPDRSTSELSFR
jgi:pimeloyl-ACP methyl ester carboxylesterase